MKNYHTIILVGGESTRFNDNNSILSKKPKSLGYIDKDALIIHVLRNFIKYNVRNFILPLGYYKNDFIKYFKKIKFIDFKVCNVALNKKEYTKFCNKNNDDINIYLYYTGLKLNKAERINKVIEKLSLENFIVSYGDAVGNINLKKIYNYHIKSNCLATGVGMIMRSQYGHYSIKNKLVDGIIEKPLIKNMVNIGYFFFRKDSKDFFSKYKHLDLEKGIIKKIINKNTMNIYEHKKFWKSVDTLKDLIELREFLKNN